MLTAIPPLASGVGGTMLAPFPFPFPVLLLLLLLLLHAAGAICINMSPITRDRITTCCNFNMVAWILLYTGCNCTLVALIALRVVPAKCCTMSYILSVRNYPVVHSLTLGCYAKLLCVLSPKVCEGGVNKYRQVLMKSRGLGANLVHKRTTVWLARGYYRY